MADHWLDLKLRVDVRNCIACGRLFVKLSGDTQTRCLACETRTLKERGDNYRERLAAEQKEVTKLKGRATRLARKLEAAANG